MDQGKLGQPERQWLAEHDELVVGMPAVAWPPYVFTDGRGNYAGPLDAFAAQVAVRLGLKLSYRSYPSNTDAQQALLDGKVDMLVGVAPSPTRPLQMQFTSELTAVPRAILLAGEQYDLSLEKARGLRWVCVFGVSACDELLRLGILDLVTVDSRDEAIFMLKEGRADAYLSDLPTLNRMQILTGMKLITVDWMRDTSLAMAVAPDNPVLLGLLDLALKEISPAERRRILEKSGILGYELTQGNQEVVFNQHEQAWLAQHPIVRFGVFPDWPGMSEIDDQGRLKPGYIADLLVHMSQHAGIKFEMVRTGHWRETLEAFQAGKIDIIPAITPTMERQRFARFTPDYGSLSRVIVARAGSKELSSLRALQGRRVGIVGSSVDEALVSKMGADIVRVDNYSQMLSLLDNHSADYVLLSVNTLGQSLQQGNGERYQVVFSGPELNLSMAMAVQQQEPMLQQILTKVLLSIQQEELSEMERRWLSLTIQTGITPDTVLLWFSLGGAVFVLSVLLFIGWNRTLRRQINQRREAEQRLEEQLLFVQMMLDALPNQIVLTNERYEIAMTNRAYRQMFLQGEDLSGAYDLLLKERLPEAIRTKILEEDAWVWESGEELNGSGENQLPDGSVRHMIYTKRLFVGPDNRRLGILTVLTDVTRMKEAEARARQAETRLTQITDSMPGIVYQYHWLGPGVGHFLYASQGLKEMVGYKDDPVRSGLIGSDILGLSDIARGEFSARVADCANTLSPLDVEVEIVRDGQTRYLQVRGHFVRQKGLDGLILNGVVQDITKLKRQELELRQARVAAEEAMQARSRFLATMSHELRTPISGMHGMLELLQISQLDDDQRYLLRNVTNSTNSLLYLVSDILDFSKIEAGQLHLEVRQCRLQTVLCDVIRGQVAKAYAKGLTVSLHWSVAVPEQAEMDAVRVGQVLTNLLSNAVKFTDQGQIRIEVGMEGASLRVAVTDTGIGIAKGKQDRLFTPFEQVESDITRRYGGTGLGLAICRQLISFMRGTLTLSSELGQGTCLSFTLPLGAIERDVPPLVGGEWWLLGELAEVRERMVHMGALVRPLSQEQLRRGVTGYLLADEQSLQEALGDDWLTHLQGHDLRGIVLSPKEALRSRLAPDSWWRLGSSLLYPDLLQETCLQLMNTHRQNVTLLTAPNQLCGHILVADDHPINRALLARQLGILGIEVELVEDGEKALQAWRRQSFDLLLTDCHMPVMDGYSLTRTLRAAGDDAPIIGVTADVSEEARGQMQAAGMNDMLFKPYSLDSLRQMLSRWLPAMNAAKEPEQPVRQMASAQASTWLSLFGEEAVARDMAREYLDSNRLDGEEMMRALECQDTQALVEVAHRIKGAARMVGQSTLAAEAAQLESAARLKQMDRLTELSHTVVVLMNGITREIGAWLDE